MINRTGSGDRLILPTTTTTTTSTTTSTTTATTTNFESKATNPTEGIAGTVSIHIAPGGDDKGNDAAAPHGAPRVFTRDWFQAQSCGYASSCLAKTCSFVTSIGKAASSTAAGALSLSQLALVLYATGNPEMALATAGAGALTGAVANIAHQFESTEECARFLMKLLGTAQRFQAVAGGSAPWAGRFAGMVQSYAVTKAVEGALGGIYGEAAHEGAFRAALTTGTFIGISDVCGMVQVCNSAVQELAAWAAYLGDTPLLLPDLAGPASNLQKGVTYTFSAAAAVEAANSAKHLRPGPQMPHPLQDFNALFTEPATSAMFTSSALGFLVAAISFHYSVDMEGSDWIDCSKQINGAIDAVEKHFKTEAEASARKDKFGDRPLEELSESERTELKQAQDEAVETEKQARSCCATLGKTLEGISKKLTGEYVRIVGGTMDMATISPFRNCRNCLGESRVAQTIGLVCRALTTPAAAIGGYAAIQTLLPQLEDSPALQRSVMMAGYAEYTLFWLGTLFPWHEARTDPAMDQLRATDRTWQSELFRAGLVTVGTGALSLVADHLLDEANANNGRVHTANEWSDVSGYVLMGAGIVGLGSHLLAQCVGARPSGIDTERAFDATMALAIGAAVGSLDGEQYGAYTAAAGVAVGQLAAIAERMRRIEREGGDKEGDAARRAAVKNKTVRAEAASAKRLDATAKELATKPPEQQQQALLDGIVKMAHAAKMSRHLDLPNAAAAINRSIATLPEGERDAARANVQAFLEMFREMPDFAHETKGGNVFGQPPQMAFHTIPVDLMGNPQTRQATPVGTQPSAAFANGSSSSSSSSSAGPNPVTSSFNSPQSAESPPDVLPAQRMDPPDSPSLSGQVPPDFP